MELVHALLARAVVRRAPRRVRRRLARLLYDYMSPRVKGVDLVLPYLDENLRFLANSKELIGWNIFFHGAYEADTNDVLRRFLRPGDVVIEAGANNGSETVLIGELVGAGGHVHAFEPVPSAARRLRANIALNDQGSRVTVHPLAIGATDGTLILHLLPHDHPNPGMASKNPHPLADTRLEVPQVSLDAWSARENVDRIDFIKMDIQGAELDLLQGAEKMIATRRPIIFTEAASTQGETLALFNALVERGYAVFTADERLRPISDHQSLPDGNWLAFPETDPRRPHR